MRQRAKLVVGNWKMFGSLAANEALLHGVIAGLKDRLALGQVGVCVPFPYLAQVQEILGGTGLWWGAQDVSAASEGAFTGQVSVSMLREFGTGAVLVGHSERRQYNGESDALVGAKAARAIAGGVRAIACVGETLDERESGRTEAVVLRQVDAILDALALDQLVHLVLAYEPVWAIGTGRTAGPEEAQAVHAAVRRRVLERAPKAGGAMTILYGGSVKPGNAAELFSMPDIDGGLVGGASLVAQDFIAIAAALPVAVG